MDSQDPTAANETSRGKNVLKSVEGDPLFSNNSLPDVNQSLSIDISPDKFNKQLPQIKVDDKILVEKPKKQKKPKNLTDRVKIIKNSMNQNFKDL